MRKIVVLGIALGLTAGLGSLTLVHADCAYHKAQSALERAKTSKEVASVPTVDQTATGQVRIARSDKADKPAPQVKH